MAESVEYRALLECSDHLVIALKSDPMTLGMELVARGLVPPRDVSYRRTALEQAQELAGSILDRVKFAPSRYRDFVEIVSRHQWMEDFVETLENTYHEKTGKGISVHMKKDSSDREDAADAESACDEFSCDLTDIPHGKSSSLDISNPVVRFSDLDEDDREDLLAQIDELTEKIELEFGKLIDKVLSSFWDSGVDHNRVIVTLIGKEKLFKEEDLAGTQNIDDVFKIIRPYCSYFNYDLIETLIQIHGSQQAKAYFKKYIQAFSSYCRAIPCVEEMCSNKDMKSKRTKLKFKLDFDRQQLKPDAVRSIKRKIAKQLGMRPSALFLCGIKEGCILLEFLVPTFIAEQLFPLSKAQRIGLQRNTKALSVECEALNVNIELKFNIKPGSKKATSYSHSDNSSQTSDTVRSPNKFIRWMRHTIALKSKETQLGRKLRRTFSRDPEAILQRYRESSPRQLDVEIQGTDTPPITCTTPDSAYMANGNNHLALTGDQIYNTSQISGSSGASSYSGMSGVSQNHGSHRMPRLHSSHNVINHQPHASHPNSTLLPGFQFIPSGYSTLPHVQQQKHTDPLSSLPVLTHPSGAYVVYPQHAASQPIQPLHSERANSTLSSHSGNSHKGSGRQSPASVSQHIQHPSPHMQPIPVYQPVLQSHFISPSDLAVVERALMHNRHCQIPGCCCQGVRELVEGNRGRIPYDSPEMSVSSSGSSRIHRINKYHPESSSDSGYGSCTDRTLRPPSLRLLSDEHNRNPNLHPHYHLTTKSHMRRVSIHAPVDHRRSKSLSDLTPLTEVPETLTKTPAIGGSVKAGTPVYNEHNRTPNLHLHYHLMTKSHMGRVDAPINHRRSKSLSDLTPLTEVPETPAKTPTIGGSIKAGTPVYYCPPTIREDGQEKPTSPVDCRCTNQPMLLREISISADNIPALCLNDCPFTPSPLKEGCHMLAGAPSRRKGSSLQGELMQSMKPNKAPVDTAPKSSLGMESSHYDRSLDDEVKEIMQSAPARDIQKTAPSCSPLLGRKRNESTNSSLLLSDPRIRHSISPLSVGSSSHNIIMPSRRSASPYETVVHRENGIVTETTEC